CIGSPLKAQYERINKNLPALRFFALYKPGLPYVRPVPDHLMVKNPDNFLVRPVTVETLAEIDASVVKVGSTSLRVPFWTPIQNKRFRKIGKLGNLAQAKGQLAVFELRTDKIFIEPLYAIEDLSSKHCCARQQAIACSDSP